MPRPSKRSWLQRLRSDNIDPPRVVLIEWHSVSGAEVDNPKRRAIDALAPLGYSLHHPPPFAGLPTDEPLWGAGVVWAWRS